MTQVQWLLLASKVAIIAAIISLFTWLLIYTNLAPWWRDHIGRTFAFKTMILVALLLLSVPGMFWVLTQRETETVGWAGVALIGLITPVMVWRSAAFVHTSRGGISTPTLLQRWRARRGERSSALSRAARWLLGSLPGDYHKRR